MIDGRKDKLEIVMSGEGGWIWHSRREEMRAMGMDGEEGGRMTVGGTKGMEGEIGVGGEREEK